MWMQIKLYYKILNSQNEFFYIKEKEFMFNVLIVKANVWNR